MKKEILKEFKKEQVWIKVVYYGLFTLVGLALLRFSDQGITNPIKYVPMIFYCFAFLTILTYFANRIKGDYELLYFGLINVVVGTFVLVNIYYPNSGFILSDAVLLYSILNVINSGYACVRELQERKLSFFMKTAITFMLLFLGVFVVSALYDKVEYGTLILGYYFSAFGLLYLLSVFTNVVLSDKKTQKKILDYITYDEKEEVKEEKPKKEVNTKTTTKRVVKDRTIKKIKRK